MSTFENRRKTMNIRLVNYRLLLCAAVICGLLTSLTLKSSETHAFDLKGVGNFAASSLIETDPGSIRGVSEEQAERTAVPPTRVQTLGCCECVGQVVSLNVSTGQGSGSTDPFWLVNTLAAYVTAPVIGAWVTSPPAQWIQPLASPLPSTNVPPGVYKYKLKFNVLNCTIPIQYRLEGCFAADNSVIVKLDNVPKYTCSTGSCFGTCISPTISLGSLSPTTHTLEFDVTNNEGPSGLIVNAQIKGQCAKQNRLP
jgi:hypothetical protein